MSVSTLWPPLHIAATYNISDHYIVLIVSVIRAIYRLPAKCALYVGLLWAESSYNTHTQPFTLKLWVVFLQSGSFISVLRVFLF